MSAINRVKRVVDSTAPWGSPAGGGGDFGVDDASMRWTVKDLPSKNALRMDSRYVGNLNRMSFYRSPWIQTVVGFFFYGFILI
jgi:hypothetical protein